MAKELTLIFFKPDAIEKNLCTEIINNYFLANKLLPVAFKTAYMTVEQYDEHYAHIKNYDFYEGMREFIQSSKLVYEIIQGENAIQKVNELKSIIRKEFGVDGFRNLIHASDSYESAIKEIARFFY